MSIRVATVFCFCWITLAVDFAHGGWWSLEHDETDSCHELWDTCYPRSYPTIKLLLKFNTAEERIKYLAKVSVPNACRDWLNWNRCEKSKYESGPDRCKEYYYVQRYGYWVSNMTEFLNYICVEQIDRLIANQHCLVDYELATSVLCCNVHQYYSSDCDEQEIVSCAQEQVSVTPGCGPDAQRLVRDIGAKLASLALYRLCPDKTGDDKVIKRLF